MTILRLIQGCLIFVPVIIVGTLGVSTGSSKESFRVFQEAKECFKSQESFPSCVFLIHPNASRSNVKAECLSRGSGSALPALRVTGEFIQVRLTCATPFPIDFIYHGTQPTEAMFVEWSKVIHANTSLEEQLYSVEVTVHSVQSLFDYYNDPANSYFENPLDGLPNTDKIDYSRSGHFTFPGVFNKTIGTSFYLFLEDTPTQKLLRNKETMKIISLSPSSLLVPCRPSHFHSNVTLDLPAGVSLTSRIFNPVEGFRLEFPPPGTAHLKGTFTCNLITPSGKVLDSLKFLHPPPSNINETYFGLEGMNPDGGNTNLEISRVVGGDCTEQRFLHPLCKTTHPNVPVDLSALRLTTVPVHNFGYLRLVQQFAHPKFVNLSYTAKTSTHWDPLIREVRVTNGLTLRMGAVYCSTGSDAKLIDYGASLRADKFVAFGYGLDWAKFDRRNSAVATHFHIASKDRNLKDFYIGMEVEFLCRINIPVLVKPVVWYANTMDEHNVTSTTQVYIDYGLEGSNSTLKMLITKDLTSVACASSYWYSDFWRNISLSIKPKDAVKPEILSPTEYTFTLGSKGRSIKCRALGIPQPEIFFVRGGVRVTENVVVGVDSVILEFPEVTQEDTGEYECVAKSVHENRQRVQVYLQSDYDIILFITIPILVFGVTLLGAFIYVRFFRPEKTGLTKQEIYDFIRGIQSDQESLIEGNNYAHDFAAARPYAKEFEIPRDKFIVDESRVLGSGAFGLVLMGEVDKKPVAVKTVQRNADKQYIKALLSELKIMIYLGHHDHLVPIVGAFTKDLKIGHVFVFVDYVPNGNLQNFLRSNQTLFTDTLATYTNVAASNDSSTLRNNNKGRPFASSDLLLWSKQIAEGMEYLGLKKVIHGDLAARNILLDTHHRVKITDFGLSRQLYDYNDYIKKQQEPLPWRWMALESLKFMTFSVHSDIWAYGVTLWEIFSLGEVPYPGCSWTLDFVDELEAGLRMGKPKYATLQIFELMASCWNSDPFKRPSFGSFKDSFRSILQAHDELERGETEDSDGYIHIRE